MSATIHPSAIVDPGARLGDATQVWHFTHVCAGARIGAACSLGQNVFVGNDVYIGDRVKIQNNVSIYDAVTLEDEVFCGPSMVFTNVYNPRAAVPRKHEYRRTLVRRGATIGANATIVCGVTVGAHAFVAAGAVVNRDVRPHALVAGVPARQIGWVSRSGDRLALPLSGNGAARCPHTDETYVLHDGACSLADASPCPASAAHPHAWHDPRDGAGSVAIHGEQALASANGGGGGVSDGACAGGVGVGGVGGAIAGGTGIGASGGAAAGISGSANGKDNANDSGGIGDIGDIGACSNASCPSPCASTERG